jgi:hypothetical protein
MAGPVARAGGVAAAAVTGSTVEPAASDAARGAAETPEGGRRSAFASEPASALAVPAPVGSESAGFAPAGLASVSAGLVGARAVGAALAGGGLAGLTSVGARFVDVGPVGLASAAALPSPDWTSETVGPRRWSRRGPDWSDGFLLT